MNPLVDMAPEVQEAIAGGKPVVALESTIIAHGMSYPRNVETALSVEAIVRSNGATPCTIAILEGRVKAGLSGAEIEWLGRNGPDIQKCSTKDLSGVIATNSNGATTVAATARIASLCSIRVFATGGIGGVHRQAETTFDISADLHELARSQVAVVSAGAKAILDLPLTLEVLETLGVPVIGFGSSEFPAFYSRSSGLSLANSVASARELADIMHAHWSLGLQGGILVANPIEPQHEISRDEIAPFLHEALGLARREGIRGKAVTPFLLAELAKLTDGRSLGANIALVENNAKVAALIAAAYSEKVSRG